MIRLEIHLITQPLYSSARTYRQKHDYDTPVMGVGPRDEGPTKRAPNGKAGTLGAAQ